MNDHIIGRANQGREACLYLLLRRLVVIDFKMTILSTGSISKNFSANHTNRRSQETTGWISLSYWGSCLK